MSKKLTLNECKSALELDDVTVKAGRIIRVWNKNRPRFSNADKMYFSVWVEDADGGNERCLLLTDSELARAEYRASRNKEDLTKKDFFTNFLD